MQDDLDQLYGVPRAPEKVDQWENRKPDSLSELDESVASVLIDLERCVQAPLLRHSARVKNYIWAMDVEGSVRIAVEELAVRPPEVEFTGYPRRRGFKHVANETKLGHPTLLEGGPARIAGELAFDEIGGSLKWVLNANSGRYCKGQPPTRSQVDKAADIFRQLGINVAIDYL